MAESLALQLASSASLTEHTAAEFGRRYAGPAPAGGRASIDSTSSDGGAGALEGHSFTFTGLRETGAPLREAAPRARRGAAREMQPQRQPPPPPPTRGRAIHKRAVRPPARASTLTPARRRDLATSRYACATWTDIVRYVDGAAAQRAREQAYEGERCWDSTMSTLVDALNLRQSAAQEAACMEEPGCVVAPLHCTGPRDHTW